MAIPRYEVPPVTDGEWAEALSFYGRDREERHHDPDHARRFDPAAELHSSPTSSPKPKRGLARRNSSDSLFDQLDPTFAPSPHIPAPTRESTHASVQSGFSDLNGSAPSAVDHLPLSGQASSSRRTSFSSADGINAVGSVNDPIREPAALGIGYTVPGPREMSCPEATEAEKRSGEAERRQLREHYEREGWLPGPEASRTTRIRRKRAIRRLGLCCNQETTQERQAVLARYAELAKSIFQTSTANVAILMSDEMILWGTQPDEPPMRLQTQKSISAHAVLRDRHECTIIADLKKDWRFRNNPGLADWPYKFYASAPLRYSRNGVQVDIGALCIHDENPRNTFDAREQSILLNLAEMLVYQLITLQSEIMAKKSSSMYENCISFLRRSVTPQTPQAKEAETKSRKKAQDKENNSRPGRRHPRTSATSPLNRPKRVSRVDSGSSATLEPEPVVAVKTGPRDTQTAKHEDDASDRTLFVDAAKTLRRILKADAVAVVNIDEYQLFIRRASGADLEPSKRKIKDKTKESIIASFLQGKPWPEDIDPVIHYVPRSRRPGVTVLGTDSENDCTFHFDRPGSEQTLSEFLQTFLKSRHFWWDREDSQDELAQRIMDLMPGQTQTTLGTAFITWEGKTKFAMFASWDRPPAEFGDSQTVALPFAWILGGCLSAAMAIRKIRSLELSQISYSNLQAHELRTPLHQILAITQLLRSSMNDLAETPVSANSSSLTTTQQIRDLLPFLDAIDTSGKTLHGIVDNILSFLDLKGKDNMMHPTSPSLLTSPTGATRSIEVMFEELIHDACEEDKRSRRANGLPMCNTETVFEIVPPLLGEQVTEDTGGALRRALSKILSNAYKFIEGEGCVEIYVDDVPDLLPPEGCEDLALTKRIKIKIVDSGKGMDPEFVHDKLGEPWAKEDPYATGSGLSVHLAYRIIGLMSGEMKITSGSGQGCMVEMEVPVPRRIVTSPPSPEMGSTLSMSLSDPIQLAKRPEDIELQRKVALVGFDTDGPGSYGLSRLALALEHQYTKLGCEVVEVSNADLVIMDGRLEETLEGSKIFEETPAKDIVFLVGAEHDANQDVLATGKKLGKTTRRFRKPATPSILRETLFPGQSKALLTEDASGSELARTRINAPEQVTSHGRTASTSTLVEGTPGEKPRPHFADEVLDPGLPGHRTPLLVKDNASTCSIVSKLAALWKPRNMEVEDAVACLSLGDYFSSRKRSLVHTPSNASSSGPPSTAESHDETTATPSLGSEGDRFEHGLPVDITSTEEMTEEEAAPEELVKVLVVEDNMVNRKILVKILSSKLPIEVLEAEDGHAAVELFREFTSPVIVLLDINMPKMDGYQACQEMRAIEKAVGRKGSQIIAVTALSSEEERRRGLVECGMNQWHTKPCSKVQIHKIVEEARTLLVEAKEEIAEIGLGL